MKSTFLKIYFCCFLTLCSAIIHADPSKKIFKKISPSVVLIENGFIQGSGIVLNSKGIILTNYHLVNTSLPLKISAKVQKGKVKVQMTFDRVKIHRVHRILDLALLKVKLPPNVRMKPTSLSQRTPNNDEVCYTIGRSWKNLKNEIGKVKITLERQTIFFKGKNSYGNSGGALVDKEGKVLGILCVVPLFHDWKWFAYSSIKAKKEDFIKEEIRKESKVPQESSEEASRWTLNGNKWLNRSLDVLGKAKEHHLRPAFIDYAIALTLDPYNATTFLNLGLLFALLRDQNKAKKFFLKSIEFDTENSPFPYQHLAGCENILGNTKKAFEYWKKAILCESNNKCRSECAMDLGLLEGNYGNYYRSAYLLKWANSLHEGIPSDKQKRRSALNYAIQKLNASQQNFINRKRSNFSFEEMELEGEELEGIKEPEDVKNSQKNPPFSTPIETLPNPKPEKVSQTDQLSKLKNKPSEPELLPFVQDKTIEKALAEGVEPGASGFLKRIPQEASDCVPAYGGILLVFRFSKMKRLGVFHIPQLRFVKYFPLPNLKCLYACGGKTLIIYDPLQKNFLIYDLETFEKIKETRSPVNGTVKSLSMEPFTSDKALIYWFEKERMREQPYLGFLNIPSMVVAPLPVSNLSSRLVGPGDNSYRTHFRFAPLMKRFTAWRSGVSSQRFIVGTIQENKVKELYNHESFGSLSFMKDQNFILGSHHLLSATGEKLYHFKGEPNNDRECWVFPVYGSNMILQIQGNKASLINATDLYEFKTFILPFQFELEGATSLNFTLEKFAFASAYLKRMVIIHNYKKEIIVFKIPDKPLDSNQSSVKKKQQPPTILRGQVWTYKLNFAEGTKIVIEDSPQGVQFDSASMSLKWRIPTHIGAGIYTIEFSVTHPGNQVQFKTASVKVE